VPGAQRRGEHAGRGDEGQVPEVASADEVRLRTVGFDIGSATSHLVFSVVELRRAESSLSSRFVVVRRETTWASPVALTPYSSPAEIDGAALLAFLRAQYDAAGLMPDDIDTGAVILTGNALLRRNSRVVADVLSAHAGRLVCAAAGHDLESRLAAHGSGAVRRSRSGRHRVLNIDIGGGTTKFALAAAGEVVDTAALALGSRLMTWDASRQVREVTGPLEVILAGLGVPLRAGDRIPPAAEQRIAAAMARLITGFASRRDAGTPGLVLLEPRLPAWDFDTVSFSGGVAEYLHGRGPAALGDLGESLGHALRDCQAAQAPLASPGECIRATVVGAGQYSAQVSGSTIFTGEPGQLPVHGIPVVRVHIPPGSTRPQDIACAVAAALGRAPVMADGALPALALSWPYPPEYQGLRALAEGVARGLPATAGQVTGGPGGAVIVVDQDLAQTLGRLLTQEADVGRGVICLDGVSVSDFDYLDIGEVMEPSGVVPLMVRSLLFPLAA
jgi:ethanolamine utilization protein EutA